MTIASRRLLKKPFAAAGEDGVAAVVEGQLNLDRAIVLEFGSSVAGDLVLRRNRSSGRTR
jgi:hypothetical protein